LGGGLAKRLWRVMEGVKALMLSRYKKLVFLSSKETTIISMRGVYGRRVMG
jgi:hypothetical protein